MDVGQVVRYKGELCTVSYDITNTGSLEEDVPLVIDGDHRHLTGPDDELFTNIHVGELIAVEEPDEESNGGSEGPDLSLGGN